MSEAPSETRRAGLSALARVFADARYRRLFAASAGAMSAQWMQRIALGWLVWELTESAVWLGALAIAELAPGIILGPLGGVLADRADRRKIVVGAQLVLMVQALMAGAAAFLDAGSPALYAALAAIGGSAAATQESARSLLVRDVTPRDCLATGMSVTAISVNVSRFLGPALAGPLMHMFGAASVFAVNALVSVALIAVVARLDVQPVARAGRSAAVALDLWRGAVAAATHRTVTPVLAVFAATALLIRPLYELMPAFADRLFGGDVQDYSMLVMAVGVGAVVGAVIVTLSAPQRPGAMFMWSSVGACGALVVFAISRGMTSAMASAAVLGLFMCASAATSQLVVIMDAHEETSGRVLSLWSTIMRAGPALGAVAAGAALDLLGYRWPLLIAAVACAAIIGAVVLDGRRRDRTAAIVQSELNVASD